MSKADRCKVLDEHGHRCRRKAGHLQIPAKDGTDRNLWHYAFDHRWRFDYPPGNSAELEEFKRQGLDKVSSDA